MDPPISARSARSADASSRDLPAAKCVRRCSAIRGLIKAVDCSRILMCVRFAVPTAAAPVDDVGMAE